MLLPNICSMKFALWIKGYSSNDKDGQKMDSVRLQSSKFSISTSIFNIAMPTSIVDNALTPITATMFWCFKISTHSHYLKKGELYLSRGFSFSINKPHASHFYAHTYMTTRTNTWERRCISFDLFLNNNRELLSSSFSLTLPLHIHTSHHTYHHTHTTLPINQKSPKYVALKSKSPQTWNSMHGLVSWMSPR